jgi:GH15 family glucan-1,4-alpha-glucosidase
VSLADRDDDRPIADYALIGDSRGTGLISSDGSLDWLCLPRPDSPSLFGALLDARAGGRFRVRPSGPFRTERRYLPMTNVLETVFRTPGGAVALRDAMAVSGEPEKRRSLTPEHELLRELRGLEGEVELEVLYEPRPDYGRCRPSLEPRGRLGLWCRAGRGALVLNSDLPLAPTRDGHAALGRHRLRAGERAYLSCCYAEEAPAVIPPLGAAASERMERARRWWTGWADRCTYQGEYRDAVLRSALALKLMAYAPSGAIVAAPTTSLPERVGGDSNYDYRFCWLRDSALTVRALVALGYRAEASAFVSWMLHSTRLTQPELQVVHDVFGHARLPERELTHLAGYRGSRPVRVGNAADRQLQLDVYGEVADAVHSLDPEGAPFDRDTAALLRGVGETVCRRWREPDDGIWESRSERRHYTHSKVLCWVALDRLLALHRAGRLGLPVERFRAERDAIRTTVEARGYSAGLGAYARTLDGDELDASLLTLPLYGYAPATDPRMRSTLARIRERLGRGALIYRYARPEGRREGAFGICSFWAVECLARGGQADEARHAFERLLGYGNDVGLFAEEIDAETGAALGNFPQAFTHVGLINAALALSACGRAAGTAGALAASTEVRA